MRPRQGCKNREPEMKITNTSLGIRLLKSSLNLVTHTKKRPNIQDNKLRLPTPVQSSDAVRSSVNGRLPTRWGRGKGVHHGGGASLQYRLNAGSISPHKDIAVCCLGRPMILIIICICINLSNPYSKCISWCLFETIERIEVVMLSTV